MSPGHPGREVPDEQSEQSPHHGHGRLLNSMDNAAFEREGAASDSADASPAAVPLAPAASNVEMGEFCSPGGPGGPGGGHGPGVVIASELSSPVLSQKVPLCKPELCRSMQVQMPSQVQAARKPPSRPNPWSRFKTVLLVGTLVGLVLWASAYLTLEYVGVL